jgi:hypothetical protein
MAKNILAEAIADAKDLRETAVANAKIALEETFTPTLQRLVSTRIQEEDEDGEVDIDLNFSGGEEEGGEDMEMGFDTFDSGEDEAPDEDEMEMESLMRELDGMDDEEPVMEYDEEELEEALSRVFESDHEMDLEEGDEYELEEGEDYELEEGEEDWQDSIGESYDEEELEEALSRVFEMDGLGDDLDMGENHEDGSAFTENPPSGPQFLERRRLRNENAKLRYQLKKLQKQLNESLRANVTYKKVLNEVNLLNSKLMYNTKVLRKFDLTEGQRERILNSFDRAGSVREVELVYTTVCEAFNKKSTKTRMTEGFASKNVRQINPSRRGNIVNEGLVDRMQRLANIKRLDD